MDAYHALCERLLGDAAQACEMQRARAALFSTWAMIQGFEDLGDAASDLCGFEQWLSGWGFPGPLVSAHVAAIRRRLDEVGL